MAAPVLARSSSVAWRSWCQGSEVCDTLRGGVKGTGEEKGLFQNNLQSSPMNWTPISGQSLLGELLEHVFQLSFTQKESRSGTETTLWCEPKHTKWEQSGDSLQKAHSWSKLKHQGGCSLHGPAFLQDDLLFGSKVNTTWDWKWAMCTPHVPTLWAFPSQTIFCYFMVGRFLVCGYFGGGWGGGGGRWGVAAPWSSHFISEGTKSMIKEVTYFPQPAKPEKQRKNTDSLEGLHLTV